MNPVRIFQDINAPKFWGTKLEDATWAYKLRQLDSEVWAKYVGWEV